MKADFRSFQRASSVGVLGLSIQLAIAITLLLFSVYAKDHAAFSASLFSFVGVFVWLWLVILFDQHRRERLEALEAEALAATEGESSVFEQSGTELRLASRRLQMLYKWVIPGISLAVAAMLIGLGYWRFTTGRPLTRPGELGLPLHRGWGVAFGLLSAFVGFVFARFVSGMAKQPIWANLRGGAAYAVGASLIGLVMAIGHFVDIAGSDAVRRALPAAIPAAMMGLGAEVVLNFLLDLYRPRRRGEFPRPAFDSRVLGLISAPDRIARSIGEALDYQFGFGVQETWFYRLLLRSWPVLVVIGAIITWGLSSFAVLAPDQQGMVLRFGRIVRDDLGPGLHIKAPWPIDRVVIPEVTDRTEDSQIRTIGRSARGVRTLQLSSPPAPGDGPILWTNEHASEEVFHVCQPSVTLDLQAGASAGQDLALVAMEVPLSYAVNNPRLFDLLGAPGVREDLLRVVGQRVVTRVLSSMSIDSILGADRGAISAMLRAEVQTAFDALNPGPDGTPMGAGVEVLGVIVMRMHPPREVAPKFEQVVMAEQYAAAKIETARGVEAATLSAVAGSVDRAREIAGAIEDYDKLQKAGAGQEALDAQEQTVLGLISNAAGESARLIAIARADRWAKEMGALSQAVRYRGQLEAYRASPELFRAGMYFDTVRESLAQCRVYVVSADIPQLHLRHEFSDAQVGLDLFTQQQP